MKVKGICQQDLLGGNCNKDANEPMMTNSGKAMTLRQGDEKENRRKLGNERKRMQGRNDQVKRHVNGRKRHPGKDRYRKRTSRRTIKTRRQKVDENNKKTK